MSPYPDSIQSRLRRASQRLGLALHEMARLARLSETPLELDEHLPALSCGAFLHRIGEASRGPAAERRALCAITLHGPGPDLRLACQILNRDSRETDLLARTGEAQFALLLKDCDEDGAWSAANRLGKKLAESCVTASAFRGGHVTIAATALLDACSAASPLECLDERMRRL